MRKLTETPLFSGTLKKSLVESVAMKRGIDGTSHESLLPFERFVWTVGVESRIPLFGPKNISTMFRGI